MKLILTLCAFTLITFSTIAQNVQQVNSFNKIIISPKVEVELVKGDTESISWEAFNVDESKVQIVVKRNRLSIFLEDARITTKYTKEQYGIKYPMYSDEVVVKARITYVDLKKIEIRGEERLTILSDLENDKKLVLKAYGTSKIRMEGVNTNKLKTVLIGENELEIKSGAANNQKIKTIGENSIFSDNFNVVKTKANAIGENDLNLNVSGLLQVWAIGASEIWVSGNPSLHKGLVIGENDIRLKH